MLASVRDANASGSREEAAATTQTVATARASERRNGACRDDPPLSSKETDDGTGIGRGERDEQRHGPDDSSLRGGKHTVLHAG